MTLRLHQLLFVSALFVASSNGLEKRLLNYNGEVDTTQRQYVSSRLRYNDALSGRCPSSLIPQRRPKRFFTAVFAVVTIVTTVAQIGLSIYQMKLQREAAEAAARRFEETMRFKLTELCISICATEWSHWSHCSQNCGGGTRKRDRKVQIIGQCKTLTDFKCPYANQLQQSQVCNYFCPNGGTPAPGTGGCACRKGYEGQCCIQETLCHYPGKPSNGAVAGSFPAKYRQIAMFSCLEGFVLDPDGEEVVMCRETGQWSARTPKCLRVTCIMPRVAQHVQIINRRTEYLYLDRLVYDCNEGYALRGPESRECLMDSGQSGRWSEFSPICLPIKCKDPGYPVNGHRVGNSIKYGAVVNFTCDQGFKLIGSRNLRCLASGSWFGHPPKCEQITCEEPLVPRHGDIRVQHGRMGATALFMCDEGYILQGATLLQCLASGYWNDTEPTCKATMCGDPGVPEHGSKDGMTFYFPHSVTYECFRGFQLIGQKKIQCLATARWSDKPPLCQACPTSTFMNDDRECQSCPAHMHTMTEGSTSKLHCSCDHGYMGPPGGPCEQIKCPSLFAPMYGTVSCDDVIMGSVCHFACHSGYIIGSGATRRTCQVDSNWDAQQPTCVACPLNTYKASEGSCLPCPQNSYTNDTGQMLESCICGPGYDGPPGGPCQDIDECNANNGHGPCEDECRNINGSFTCDCSRPGYKLNPDNKLTCKVEKQCKNMTQEEAPLNGGLVCHWFYEENSQHCSVKCNDGYEFPSRINNYETCGPTTGFEWSYRTTDPMARLEPCVEEFFPNYRIEADSSYFVRACQDLTAEEQLEVKREFANKLNENRVCQRRATQVCNIKDMGIICGRRERRRRRRDTGQLEILSSLDFVFNVSALSVTETSKDCNQICQFLKIPAKYCKQGLCVRSYKRFLQAAVINAKLKLGDIFHDVEKRKLMLIRAANREFEPEQIYTSELISNCKPGMKSQDGQCVPCLSASFYDPEINECVECPAGTYQPLNKQEECLTCPPGTTSTVGLAYCLECPEGMYGSGCASKCSCQHGLCDSVTGSCQCENGYEGKHCHKDIPGCRSGRCFEGVTCHDVPAPGTGYKCGACPKGFEGDGQNCHLIAYST